MAYSSQSNYSNQISIYIYIYILIRLTTYHEFNVKTLNSFVTYQKNFFWYYQKNLSNIFHWNYIFDWRALICSTNLYISILKQKTLSNVCHLVCTIMSSTWHVTTELDRCSNIIATCQYISIFMYIINMTINYLKHIKCPFKFLLHLKKSHNYVY